MSNDILVIGDLMLDEYWWGDVNYISPEAPVPVVEANRIEFRLGGACNVANNIKSLGGEPILIGIAGNDRYFAKLGYKVEEHRIDASHILRSMVRRTTRKIRMMGGHQQLLRVDFEDTFPVEGVDLQRLCCEIESALQKHTITHAVVSDYAKGVIGPIVFDILRSHKVTIIVDPKPKNVHLYKGVHYITPNYSEFEAMCDILEIDTSLQEFGDRLGVELILTRGEHGITTRDAETGAVRNYPAEAQQVYDVTGAGDTVVAALAVRLNEGSEMSDAIVYANRVAAIVVGKVGTATATHDEVVKYTAMHVPPY